MQVRPIFYPDTRHDPIIQATQKVFPNDAAAKKFERKDIKSISFRLGSFSRERFT